MSKRICDCATLGGLIKSATLRKIYPAPFPPFQPWTYERMVACIISVGRQVPSYCVELFKSSNGLVGSKDNCHVPDLLFECRLERVTVGLQGLDLESVLSKS